MGTKRGLEMAAGKKASDFLVFLRTKGTSLFCNASVLMIIFGNKNAPTVDFDCAMAAQNMMLAAHSKGIGSCWIGGLPGLMDEKILKEIGRAQENRKFGRLIKKKEAQKILNPCVSCSLKFS